MRGTWQTTDSGGGSFDWQLVGLVATVCIGVIVLGPVIVAIVHVLAIVVLALVGAAVASLGGLLVWRRKHSRAALPPWQPGVLGQAQRPAAPRELHLHLHDVTPDQIAQALAQLPGAAAHTVRKDPSWPS